MESLKNKNILIIGLGISGFEAAVFLKQKGALVTLTDMADEEKLAPYAAKIRDMGIPMELGKHSIQTVNASDLIILSPGVPPSIEPVSYALNKGIPVINEIELAATYIKEPIIAITGTNGKTTTTRLTEEMLKSCGYKVFTGGNIGNPLITYAGQKEKADIIVVEISSFQLDTIKHFRPSVGVLLNITEDHLDRYPDMDAYATSKFRIFKNQEQTDVAILNDQDPLILARDKKIKSQKYYFGLSEKGHTKATINCEKVIFSREKGSKAHTIDLDRAGLKGRHNHENIAAAALATLAVGGNIKGIKKAVSEFTGLSHRLEYVTSINGVTYYDDSKATNVDAVLRALDAFQKDVILIMGGRDKGGDYRVLETLIKTKVKCLIIIGEAKEIISNALSHLTQTFAVETLEEAVGLTQKTAKPGDTVLLSPACSSFDMFDSYAQRGKQFCSHVNEIKEMHSNT